MDFSYTDEQQMLRDTLGRYLAERYDFETRRKAIASESGWSPEIWKAFAEELGILGAGFSEDHGGLGGGAVETMIVMEELGKGLVVEPYLGTAVIGGGFLKAVGGELAEELIPGIIAGEVIGAFAYAEPKGRYDLADLQTTAKRSGDGWTLDGRKAVVVGAPWATHLFVTARTAAVAATGAASACSWWRPAPRASPPATTPPWTAAAPARSPSRTPPPA